MSGPVVDTDDWDVVPTALIGGFVVWFVGGFGMIVYKEVSQDPLIVAFAVLVAVFAPVVLFGVGRFTFYMLNTVGQWIQDGDR